jgi:hypothetical protein
MDTTEAEKGNWDRRMFEEEEWERQKEWERQEEWQRQE